MIIITQSLTKQILTSTKHKLITPSLLGKQHYNLSTDTVFSLKKYSLVDDYQITGFIGKGSTSRVYQGYNILTRQEVIIKLFKDIIPQQKILHEIRTNQIIMQCKHIIPMVDVVRDEGCGSYGLIFENLHGVPLNQLVGKFQFIKGLKYMKDVLQALDFIHKKGVIHRDLKNSNILITSKGAKLFDFGLSRIENVDEFITKRFGTKCYYTPEVMFKIPHFNYKIDIWVCGLIMAEVLSHIKPLMPYSSDQTACRQIVQFSGYNEDIVGNSVLRTVRRTNFIKLLQNKHPDRKVIENAALVIQKMMRIDPNQRPTAEQVLKQEIFKNLHQLQQAQVL